MSEDHRKKVLRLACDICSEGDQSWNVVPYPESQLGSINIGSGHIAMRQDLAELVSHSDQGPWGHKIKTLPIYLVKELYGDDGVRYWSYFQDTMDHMKLQHGDVLLLCTRLLKMREENDG